jgi:hypothetical protein
MPHELSPAEIRKHPVFQTLRDAAASGSAPTQRELDQLDLPPAARKSVGEAAKRVASVKLTGENAEARSTAEASAEYIIDRLAPEHQDPDYRKDPSEGPDDPAGLADQVTRW